MKSELQNPFRKSIKVWHKLPKTNKKQTNRMTFANCEEQA